MARKSKAQIEQEALARQQEISDKAKTEAMEMFTGFMTKFMEQMGASRLAAGPAAVGSDGTADRTLAESLAHAMMVASATPQKRAALIDPVEREAREKARKDLYDLVIDNHAKGVVPIYRVTRKTFLAEMLVDPEYVDPVSKRRLPREVNWRGIPNQAMLPVSRKSVSAEDAIGIEAGTKVYDLYRRSIGAAPVINANQASGWVTSGKELLRASPDTEAASAPNVAPGLDPAKMSQMPGTQTVRLLGKTADPAVVS